LPQIWFLPRKKFVLPIFSIGIITIRNVSGHSVLETQDFFVGKFYFCGITSFSKCDGGYTILYRCDITTSARYTSSGFDRERIKVVRSFSFSVSHFRKI